MVASAQSLDFLARTKKSSFPNGNELTHSIKNFLERLKIFFGFLAFSP
jgi:hypothetical protein